MRASLDWDQSARKTIAADLDALDVPAFDWDAVCQRAAVAPARNIRRLAGRIAAILLAGTLGLAGAALASPAVRRAMPPIVQALFSGLHLRVVDRLPGGVTVAENPQGFKYTIYPAHRYPGGAWGFSFTTSARRVTLAQAERDAKVLGFRVIPPAGLPAGTRLLLISEEAPVPGRPKQVLFVYQTSSGGEFNIQELGPPGVHWSGDTPNWVQNGTQVAIGNFGHVLTTEQVKAIRAAMSGGFRQWLFRLVGLSHG